jgi:ADP-ribose pyrophosphatase YjhB (NUDIX family)
MKQAYTHYQPVARTGPAYVYCPHCGSELAQKWEGHRDRPACDGCGFVQYQNPAPTVSILVVEEGRVLLGQRGGEPGRGTWALPSGYIEYGDDFLTTAVQEVREETGLEVRIESVLNVVSSFLSERFHFFSLFVTARVLGGELAAGDDLLAVEWFPVAGPLPPLGFVEDAHAIDLAVSGFMGIPVGLGNGPGGGPYGGSGSE